MGWVKPCFSPIYGSTKSISATDSSASVELLADQGDTLLVTNLGDNVVYVELGGSSVAATTADLPILPSTAQTINLSSGFGGGPAKHSYAAAICGAGETATVKFTSGYGV